MALRFLERPPASEMDTVFQESGPRLALALPPRAVLDGKYEIGKVLGKGGFGITYAAVDRNLNIPVAIKEFLPAQVAGRGTDQSTVQPHGGGEQEVFEHGLKAFLSEARTLAQFDHANIVSVKAFFEENGTGYLVMPFYEGETLDERLDAHEGPLPEDAALKLLEPVMNGLEAVHSRNILHRDIKPQNVYLTDTGQTVLLDFGAARIAFGQESQSLSAVLTPGYAPFEQYSRRGHQGTWTDVYATAAVLYRMLTGSKPPEATDRLAGEPLPPVHLRNPSVSPTVSAAVTAALGVQPKDRPQTIHAFRESLSDGTVVASPPPDDGGGTILTSGEPELGGTILAGGGGSDEPPEVPAGQAVLVLHATRACQVKLNTGEVQSMASGEETEIPVLPGQHVVTAKFGNRQFRTREDVQEGERRVVRLAPGTRGGGRPSDRRDSTGEQSRQRPPVRPEEPRWDPPRQGGGSAKWIVGGVVGLLAVVLLIVAVTRDNDPIPGDDGAGVVVSDSDPVQQIRFQGAGIPFTTSGTLARTDGEFQTGEYADAFEFERGDARSISLELVSDDFDTYLSLISPSGEVVASDDDSAGDLNAALTAPLDEPGTYRVFATSAAAGATGGYTLTLTAF